MMPFCDEKVQSTIIGIPTPTDNEPTVYVVSFLFVPYLHWLSKKYSCNEMHEIYAFL